jgi:hypothetical protein
MSSFFLINKKNKNEIFEFILNDNTTVYELKQYIIDNTDYKIYNIHFINNGSYLDNSTLINNVNYINNKLYFTNSKSKCATCGNKCSVIIGDCKFCKCNFCLNHRLPETHNCININICKSKAFILNSNKVISEKCVASKI